MTKKHTACPECGEPSTHDRICSLCETEDAVWRDVISRVQPKSKVDQAVCIVQAVLETHLRSSNGTI